MDRVMGGTEPDVGGGEIGLVKEAGFCAVPSSCACCDAPSAVATCLCGSDSIGRISAVRSSVCDALIDFIRPAMSVLSSSAIASFSLSASRLMTPRVKCSAPTGLMAFSATLCGKPSSVLGALLVPAGMLAFAISVLDDKGVSREELWFSGR